MYCIILAGGFGKRLRPITDYVPKPMVPINNIPIIEWQIRYLKKYNVKDIIICTGYKTEHIENYLEIKNNLGINVKFSIEKEPLGTGGAIKKIKSLVDGDSFLVLNGDVLTNIDLKKMLKTQNSIAAIELRTKFGVLETKDGKITNFMEKKEIPNLWMNAGIYHFKSTIFNDLPKSGNIENTTFPRYAKEGKLNVVKYSDVIWYSIDSFKDIEESSRDIPKMF